MTKPRIRLFLPTLFLLTAGAVLARENFSTVEIVPAGKAVTLDGDLKDWAQSQFIETFLFQLQIKVKLISMTNRSGWLSLRDVARRNSCHPEAACTRPEVNRTPCWQNSSPAVHPKGVRLGLTLGNTAAVCTVECCREYSSLWIYASWPRPPLKGRSPQGIARTSSQESRSCLRCSFCQS